VAGARDESTKGGGGVIERVRDVADGLGALVGQHLKLARLELISDLRAMGRRARVIVVLVGLVVVGYALAMGGLAFLIGGNTAVGVPLLAIGGGHVVLCGAGIVLASRRRETHLMDATVEQVGQSLNTLRLAAEPATAGKTSGNGLEKSHAREKTGVR
jgi:hypothetical protein